MEAALPTSSSLTDISDATFVEGNALCSPARKGPQKHDKKAMLDVCREEQPLNRFNAPGTKKHIQNLRKTSMDDMTI